MKTHNRKKMVRCHIQYALMEYESAKTQTTSEVLHTGYIAVTVDQGVRVAYGGITKIRLDLPSASAGLSPVKLGHT